MIKHFMLTAKNIFKAVPFAVALFLVFANSSFAQYTLQNAFPNLDFNNPLYLTNSGDGTNRLLSKMEE